MSRTGASWSCPGSRARASAPGKIILFGEHFVVKGTRSIATAIEKRVTVEVCLLPEPRALVSSPAVGLEAEMSLPELLAATRGPLAPLAGIIRFFRERHGVEPTGLAVRASSGIPVGSGLGSSAAFSAAFSLAYAAAHGLKLGRQELVEASMAGERIAHGRPSGIDTEIAVSGGSIVFRRGEPPERVDLALPPGVVLLVADTGRPRSTRLVVERVLRRAELTWAAARHIYRAAEEIVGLALEAFQRGDARLLGELMDLNQGLLAAVGASSVEIERLLYAARRAGALGAKLTGAGWGGSVIVLAPLEEAERVERSLLAEGARLVFRAGIGAEGARLEAQDL